jgi:hypothetical protein
MTTRQKTYALLRALRRLALLAVVPLLGIALADLFALTPAALAPLAASVGTWLVLALIFAGLFWALAYAIDPYRTGPVPVDALFERAKRKRKWRRRLSRPERLCYDALTLYEPIAEHGLAQAISTLGSESIRAKLYTLHEVYLEKSHVLLTRALDSHDATPAAFAAQSAAFETDLKDAGFHQLRGRLATRLEELLRPR